jgi:hypothetical protein
VADQQAANSEPCVTVTAGRSAPVSARAPAAGQVYSFGGYAPCFGIYPGFGISPARSLPGAGCRWPGWSRTGVRPATDGFALIPVGCLPAISRSGSAPLPGRGARHPGCGGTGPYCDASGGSNGVLTRYLVVSGAGEVFADSHGPGWSSGGGLSRMLAAEASVMASQGGEGDRVTTKRVSGVLSAHRLCRQRLRKG